MFTKRRKPASEIADIFSHQWRYIRKHTKMQNYARRRVLSGFTFSSLKKFIRKAMGQKISIQYGVQFLATLCSTCFFSAPQMNFKSICVFSAPQMNFKNSIFSQWQTDSYTFVILISWFMSFHLLQDVNTSSWSEAKLNEFVFLKTYFFTSR